MAEKSARILLVCKRFFLTKMRPYLTANAVSIANSGIIKHLVIGYLLQRINKPMSSGFDFELVDLGLIDYQKGLIFQQNLLKEIASGKRKSVLIFCEHNPVITLGRSAKKENVLKSDEQLKSLGVEVVKTHRGGDATLHLPGQLVVYPIFDLRCLGRDVGLFLRNMEKAVITMLKAYRIKAVALGGSTGVWVDQKKIVSIGIALRNWVSYHGLSLNVSCNLDLFSLIRPCGQDIMMTSMARFLNPDDLSISGIKSRLSDTFKQVFARGESIGE